jgi:hypothetical protein
MKRELDTYRSLQILILHNQTIQFSNKKTYHHIDFNET